MSKIARLFFIVSAFLVFDACSSSRAPVSEPKGRGSATTVFGDELSLTGYSIGNKDGHTEVQLRWWVVRKPSADYAAFVHALDGADAIAFQGDHTLKNATGAPTGAWTAGDSVEDRFLMAPPKDRPAGTYTLRIGVYVPNPFKVLPLTEATLPRPSGDWANQSVVIANVECK